MNLSDDSREIHTLPVHTNIYQNRDPFSLWKLSFFYMNAKNDRFNENGWKGKKIKKFSQNKESEIYLITNDGIQLTFSRLCTIQTNNYGLIYGLHSWWNGSSVRKSLHVGGRALWRCKPHRLQGALNRLQKLLNQVWKKQTFIKNTKNKRIFQTKRWLNWKTHNERSNT